MLLFSSAINPPQTSSNAAVSTTTQNQIATTFPMMVMVPV
jgi:hypothetical protein